MLYQLRIVLENTVDDGDYGKLSGMLLCIDQLACRFMWFFGLTLPSLYHCGIAQADNLLFSSFHTLLRQAGDNIHLFHGYTTYLLKSVRSTPVRRVCCNAH